MISRTAVGAQEPRSDSRGGHGVDVEPLGDPGESIAVGVEGEDSPHDGGLGLVDHAADITLAVTLVPVAADTAASHSAGLRPPAERVVGALPRPTPLEAGR